MAARDVSVYMSEFVGTFFLVLTVGLNVLQNTPFAPISIGSILMVMIFATGSVSGGHFNPAVTVGIVVAQKLTNQDLISNKRAGIYVAVQLIAGIVAACTYWALLGATFTLKPGVGYTWFDASIVEVLFTLALVFVVLNVACLQDKSGNDFFGLSIGFTVMSAAFAIGGISGCSLNPAVSVGVMLTDFMHIGHAHSLRYLPLYIICPLIGACAASGLFYLMRFKLAQKKGLPS